MREIPEARCASTDRWEEEWQKWVSLDTRVADTHIIEDESHRIR